MNGSDDAPTGHDRLRTGLGPYVLGALPPAEHDELERHLEGCAACRADLDELRPVARALDAARAAAPNAGVDGPAALPDNPPADLGARVLASVAAERAAEQAEARRRGWVRRAGLAAIAGAAAAIVLVAGLALTRSDPPAPPSVPLEAVDVDVTGPGIAADADLVNHTWGVEVKLLGTGFDLGERYRVVVVDDAGRATPAGAFVGTGTAEMDCNLSSAVLRDDASGFEVRDADGQVVVTSTFA